MRHAARYVIIRATAAGTVPEPTDEDLKRFYDNHQAKFTQPDASSACSP